MRRLTVGIVALLFLTTLPMFAIEGLQISVQCSNVVLSWPSTNDETYIVQYRSTLDASTPWQTLTTSLPADVGTNLTFYVHSNIVLNPNCGGGGSYAAMSASTNGMDSVENVEEPPLVPMAIPANGTGSIVPLVLYPVGFDMSGFFIFDPATGETVSGAGYSNQTLSPLNARVNGLQPLDGPVPASGDGGTLAEPETGFYRVVRNGAHMFGMTNGMVLSGTVEIPYELGCLTNIGAAAMRLLANGNSVLGIASDIGGIFKWNTAFCPNGDYEIYGQCDFDGETIYSTTNFVTLNNLVHFEEFTTDFGGQIWVYGVLSVPQADVLIDVYSDAGYIGTFADSTTDGKISFVWDLTDPLGTLLTNETFYGVFNISPSSQAVAAKTSQNISTSFMPPSKHPVLRTQTIVAARANGVESPNSPSPGNPAVITWNKQYGWTEDSFVVAWGITPVINTSSRIRDMIQGGVVDILSNPAADSTYTLSPGNTFNGTNYRLLDNGKADLLSYLANSYYRNFFYYGHGNTSRIGDYNEYQGWITTIDESEIRMALDNVVGRVSRHPYRFVFLNTCNSAKGTLCEAFGIRKSTVDKATYHNSNIKARAFVGFSGPYSIPGSKSNCDASAAMLAQFFAEWMDGASLNGIIQRAKDNAYWPLDPSVTTYGAYNLFRDYPY